MQITPLFPFPPDRGDAIYFIIGMIVMSIIINLFFNEKTFKNRIWWTIIALIISLVVVPAILFR